MTKPMANETNENTDIDNPTLICITFIGFILIVAIKYSVHPQNLWVTTGSGSFPSV